MRMAPQTAVTMRELLSVKPGRDLLALKVHHQQVEAMLRMLPISLVVILTTPA
jgi:hypothetical protein